MNISYDYYRVFYYTAKYKNITAAAKALMSNQPNITRTIKLLEEALGCTLFVRSNRGVTLTPEGEKLYLHISAAFEHIQAGEEELSLEKSLQSGILSVSVTEIALHCLMLPVFKQFHKTYPNIRIQLANNTTPQAINALKSGFSDIAVVTSKADADKSLKSIPIKNFRETAVCGGYFSELENKNVRLKDLLKYPIITTGRQTKSYEFYSRFFLNHGLEFNPDIEASTADLILPMVKNDLGIGFVPVSFVEECADRENLIVIDLYEQIPERTIYLVKNTNRSLPIAAKELEKMIYDMYNVCDFC